MLNLSAPDVSIAEHIPPGARVVSLPPPALDGAAGSPLTVAARGATVRGGHAQLPFADAAFDLVLCLDALDRVLDDQAAIDEMARVLRPGGRLVLRVLHESPVAWLDAQNLYRYLQSFAGGGDHPRNCGEHGWRRHYRRSDVHELLGGGFRLHRLTGRGLGIAEPVNLATRLLARGDRSSAHPLTAGLTRLDVRIPADRLGFRLLAIAERTA